jgi:2-phospho-L-lactate guanylyltransferase
MAAAAATVLMPVKAFGAAKARLAHALDDAARAALARSMADRVADAAADMPLAVACDDDGVAGWATARGARVVWTEGLDLNGSVQAGMDALRADGAPSVVIAHGDLPYAVDLTRLTAFPLPGATIVPDRRDDGTNVLHVPLDAGFVPAYGVGSFSRHVRQLRALGLDVRIARLDDLRWDVDVPDDLPTVSATATAAATGQLVQ